MTKKEELHNNFMAFQELLPEISSQYAGKYALLRDKKLVQCFDSVRDAMIFGKMQYPDDLFSVQEVASGVVNLGYYSCHV